MSVWPMGKYLIFSRHFTRDTVFVEPACNERDIVVTSSVLYLCVCCACVVRVCVRASVRPDLSGPLRLDFLCFYKRIKSNSVLMFKSIFSRISNIVLD